MSKRREHLPSPDKQHILWSSPLKGMEQPVRSFRSFIRALPPYPSPEDQKPLPPIPSTPKTPTTPNGQTSASPSSPAPLERTSSVTSWRAPAEWEWGIPSPPSQPFRTSSIFRARKYSPLLPELLPGDYEMHAQPNLRSFASNSTQQSQLGSIRESPNDRPDPPPRNPYRSSPHQTPYADDDCGMSMSSIGYDPSAFSPYPEALRVQARFPEYLDHSSRVSDASAKAKAFASLGIGSPRNTKAVPDDWTNSTVLVGDDAPAHLTLRGKKLRPLSRGDPVIDDDLGDNELADKLRQLSFSQDYHDVLADQYHTLHAQQPETSSESQDPVSKPLAWRKGPNGLSLSSSSLGIQASAPSASGHGTRHKRMISFVPLHHLKGGHKRHKAKHDVHQRSASDSAVPRRNKIPESEVDRLLGKDLRIPNLLAHTRGFKFNKRRVKATEPGNTIEPCSQPVLLPSPPLEQQTPLLRLPGGFALVRQSPSEAPISQTASSHDASLAEVPRGGSNASSLVSNYDNSQPRSSLHSQHWQVPVAPTIAINKRQRNSMGSLQSLQSLSSTSSPPTSPLAHEISLPRTPPPVPSQPARAPRVPPFPSRPPYGSENRFQGETTEMEEDQDTHMRRILDRAKGARDAWRSHQKEIRQGKLKQSIKVLGPTDPAVVAGYVKREGRRLGYEDGKAGRMPGYLMSGPV